MTAQRPSAAFIGRIGQTGAHGVEMPLKGWREIAGFLGRDQSTVRRWAEARSLPVFRTSAGGRGVPVHAYASELEAWLRREAGRGVDADEQSHVGGGPTDEHRAAAAHAAERRAADPRDGEQQNGTRRPAFAVRPGESGAASPRLALIVGVCLGVGFCLGAAAALGGAYLAGRGPAEAVAAIAAADVPEAARDLYVRGSFLSSLDNPESVAEAIRLLRQAVAIHPGYGQAYAALAGSYNLAERHGVMSGWEAFPKAERAANRAMELDPTLERAQSALAFVEFQWHRDPAASLARFEDTLRRNPDSADTLFWYANALLMAGRTKEALPLVIRAEETAPDRSALRTLHAQILLLAGHAADSAAMLDDIAATDPNRPWPRYVMSLARLAQADYPAYLENYARFGDMIGVARHREAAAAGEAALAQGGVAAMAQAMAAVETAWYQRGEALAADVARHHAIGNRTDAAISWLRVALNRHETRLMGILADPAFRPLRDEPRFHALLAALGLPAQ